MSLTACNYDLIHATGPSGNGVAERGQHTVKRNAEQSAIIEEEKKASFEAGRPPGGEQTTALCTGGLEGVRGSGWTKGNRPGDSEEIPFIRLTSG